MAAPLNSFAIGHLQQAWLYPEISGGGGFTFEDVPVAITRRRRPMSATKPMVMLSCRYRPHPLVDRIPARLCCVVRNSRTAQLPCWPRFSAGSDDARYCGTLFCSDSKAC
jgi:hypothetical protein